MPDGVGDKLCGVQIFISHTDGGNARVSVGAVVVNSVVYVDAGGVLSALVFSSHAHRALAHFNRAEDVEKVGNGALLAAHFR